MPALLAPRKRRAVNNAVRTNPRVVAAEAGLAAKSASLMGAAPAFDIAAQAADIRGGAPITSAMTGLPPVAPAAAPLNIERPSTLAGFDAASEALRARGTRGAVVGPMTPRAAPAQVIPAAAPAALPPAAAPVAAAPLTPSPNGAPTASPAMQAFRNRQVVGQNAMRASFDKPTVRDDRALTERTAARTGLMNQRLGAPLALETLRQKGAAAEGVAERAGEATAAGIAQTGLMDIQESKNAGALAAAEAGKGLMMGREQFSQEGIDPTTGEKAKSSSNTPVLFDPKTGKKVDTATPEQKLQTGLDSIDELGASLQAPSSGLFNRGDFKGTDKTGAAADASVDKSVKKFFKANLPEIQLNTQVLEMMREGLRNGETAADLIAKIQEASSQSL
jgi:hypothetical protein